MITKPAIVVQFNNAGQLVADVSSMAEPLPNPETAKYVFDSSVTVLEVVSLMKRDILLVDYGFQFYLDQSKNPNK